MRAEDSIKAELKPRCDLRQGWACSPVPGCMASQDPSRCVLPPPPTPGPASLSVHWALSAPTARWGGGKMEDLGQERRASACCRHHLHFSSPLELSPVATQEPDGKGGGVSHQFSGRDAAGISELTA